MIRAMMDIAPRRWLRAFCQRSRLFTDERGVSAVEFALILPVMMGLYIGGVEVSKAISVNRKVTLAARTLADLVSQVPKVNAADMSNVLTAGEAVSWPFNDANLKLRVSQVEITAAGVARISWSRARGPEPWVKRDDGAILAGADDIPLALKVKDTFLIWAEVEYFYKPTIGGGFSVLSKGITLHDKIYMRPRLTTMVECNAC